jgi:hypothetical protein
MGLQAFGGFQRYSARADLDTRPPLLAASGTKGIILLTAELFSAVGIVQMPYRDEVGCHNLGLLRVTLNGYDAIKVFKRWVSPFINLKTRSFELVRKVPAEISLESRRKIL